VAPYSVDHGGLPVGVSQVRATKPHNGAPRSVTALPTPRTGPPPAPRSGTTKVVLDGDRRYNLWVFNFGLACCAVEFVAASMGVADLLRAGSVPLAPGPREADLMVVSGTVTDKMAPAVRQVYDQMPEPKYVLSFGACSNSGGPYWDSYCVTKGVDQIVPVDVYVPGCPPRPEALLQGILRLQEKLADESRSSTATDPDAPGPDVPGAMTRPLVSKPAGT
jgi:NADH-quinone oxidoreductase subunit B